MCKYFINNCTNDTFLCAPPIDFGHFGLIFAKKVRIKSKKCTKCAV